MDHPMHDRWLSVDEMSEDLAVSKYTIHTWDAGADMLGLKVCRFWRFKKLEVDRWFKILAAHVPKGMEETR